jgi:hypothetical protein
MAVDTAAKRLSMLGFANTLISLALVDASVSDSDRYTWLTLYGGIALGEPEIVIGGGSTMRTAMVASLRHRRN